MVHGTCLKPVPQDGESYKLQETSTWSYNQKIAGLSAADTVDTIRSQAAPCALFDKLAAHDDRDDDYRTSAFGAFLRKKYPEAANLDITRFFRWYLEDYSPLTDSMYPVILSKKDVDLLSVVGHHTSQGQYATAYSAQVARNIPQLNAKSQSDLLVKMAYWWTCVEMVRLALPFDMVPRLYIESLSQLVGQSARDEIKVNEFIVHFAMSSGYSKNVHSIRRNIHKIYAEIILRGLINPIYIRLLPRESLAKMLDVSSGPSLLKQTLILSNCQNAASIDDKLNQIFRSDVGDHEPRRPDVEVQYFAPFNSVTGLGETARRMAAAMTEAKLRPRYVNVDQRNGAASCDHHLTLSPPTTASINILQMNLDLLPEFVEKNRHILRDGYLIILPLWELDIPADCHSLGLTLADELWAVSRFIQNTFREKCQQIRYIGHPARCITFTGSNTQHFLRSEDKPFLFLTVFDALSWTSRKNPSAVVEAFKAAFTSEDNVKLLLKTQNMGRLVGNRRAELLEFSEAVSRNGKIEFTDETLSDAGQRALIANADCLVSLHRSEGLGIDILDCVYSGIPVIVTDYSGTRDFCTEETAWLVDAALEPVGVGNYAYATANHHWANPDIRLASQAMKSVYSNNAERISKMNCGREYVAARFASQTVGDVIKKRLGELGPHEHEAVQ